MLVRMFCFFLLINLIGCSVNRPNTQSMNSSELKKTCCQAGRFSSRIFDSETQLSVIRECWKNNFYGKIDITDTNSEYYYTRGMGDSFQASDFFDQWIFLRIIAIAVSPVVVPVVLIVDECKDQKMYSPKECAY